MDKETLSHYGWIVVLILILSVMMALATPLGQFVANGFKSTYVGFTHTLSNAINNTGANMDVPKDEEPKDPDFYKFEPGLYQTGAIELYREKGGKAIKDMLITPWETLVEKDALYGGETSKIWCSNPHGGSTSTSDNPKSNDLAGDLLLPDDGSVIGFSQFAFKRTKTLTGILLPSTFAGFTGWTFIWCSGLKEITIPDGVDALYTQEFCGCSSLESATIPNSVQKIGQAAFSGCTNLNEIIFKGTKAEWEAITKSANWDLDTPATMKIICTDGIIGGYSLVFKTDNIAYLYDENNNLVKTYTGWNDTSYSSYSEIPWRQDGYYERIMNVTMEDGVTFKTTNSLFSRCSRLISVKISSDITNIGEDMFSGCSGLTKVELPEGITQIGESAFEGCIRLSDINIPSTVKTIGTSAFRSCQSLSSIVLPEGLTTLGGTVFGMVFDGCKSLTSISIPQNITYMSPTNFRGCSSLTTVEILSGNKTTSIEHSLFKGCSSLQNIIFAGTIEEWHNIPKDYSWNESVPSTTTVTCTDGTTCMELS